MINYIIIKVLWLLFYRLVRNCTILFLRNFMMFNVLCIFFFFFFFFFACHYPFRWLMDSVGIGFSCIKQNQLAETKWKFISISTEKVLRGVPAVGRGLWSSGTQVQSPAGHSGLIRLPGPGTSTCCGRSHKNINHISVLNCQ